MHYFQPILSYTFEWHEKMSSDRGYIAQNMGRVVGIKHFLISKQKISLNQKTLFGFIYRFVHHFTTAAILDAKLGTNKYSLRSCDHYSFLE